MMVAEQFEPGALRAPSSPAPSGSVRSLTWRVSDVWAAPFTDLPIRDELIHQYIPLSPEMELLEVGPGCGFETFRLARSIKHLTVLDVAAENVRYLENIFAGRENIRFVCADLCESGLAARLQRQFDSIIAVEVFEFIPDPGTALSNLARLLRSGGALYMQFPNIERGPGTTFFRSRADLERALQDAGFQQWELYVLRLRPWAQALFHWLHEKPMNAYRRLYQARNKRPARPQIYEDTWAFRHGRRLEHFKYVIHAYWALSMLLMRAGGDIFERTPAGEAILGKNLYLAAWNPNTAELKP
jgi:SAM-dependent methyltransferase